MTDQPTAPANDPWSFEDDEPTGQGRRWTLLVVGVVPWLVVALFLLRPDAAAPTDPAPLIDEPAADVVAGGTAPSAGPVGPAPTGSDPGAPTPIAPPTGPAAPEATLVTSRGRLAPDVGDAVTVAVLVARSWFAGAGPVSDPADPELAPTQTGYVEHLWVEAVDRPWRDHAVVALGAVVLVPVTEGDQQHLRPVSRRIAVPVRLDRSGARPAGVPWRLPDPELAYDPLAFAAVADEALALSAAEALADAGYGVHELISLERSDGWPWRAVVDAAGPGRDEVTRQAIWLRRHLAGFVVAGWLPPLPSPDPSGDPVDGSGAGDGAPTQGPAEPTATEDGDAVDQEEHP